ASSRCSSVIFAVFSIPQWTMQPTRLARERALAIAPLRQTRSDAAAISDPAAGPTSLIARTAIFFRSRTEKKLGAQALPVGVPSPTGSIFSPDKDAAQSRNAAVP